MVEQSPSQSMQNAQYLALKALVAEQLLKHPDNDVKVAVAACIVEITRITAPDAPYDDDQMREVFQLIVSTFESLSDKSSRSFNKRILVLETVAEVRLCVVMLDLECNALIIEIFQHFLKLIRDHQPETIFASTATIMTLVLEESEDISVEMLFPILACVKRDNEEVVSVSRELAKRVLENCESKLKPYLMENWGNFWDDYSSVIASISQVAPSAVPVVDQNDVVFGKCEDDEHEQRRISGEEGNVMEDLIFENMLLKENRSLRIENMSLKDKISEIISKTNKIIFLCKIGMIVSWMVFLLHLWF
ncbi:sister chromatid cohesion protein PDS5 homolog B-B-like [Hibiscus syriacus]|uniref:sister chromatid cohesion protein PDS5 homolog B-B-like n=1 Tax=Hibiscus syriacus TaxID=106335 RepID=UPI001923A4C3|nr:sister chromatid cohesion protein PDS5 homolog B-B-like [Hibiscus syriacus]